MAYDYYANVKDDVLKATSMMKFALASIGIVMNLSHILMMNFSVMTV